VRVGGAEDHVRIQEVTEYCFGPHIASKPADAGVKSYFFQMVGHHIYLRPFLRVPQV
jgi:hypothetical protein